MFGARPLLGDSVHRCIHNRFAVAHEGGRWSSHLQELHVGTQFSPGDGGVPSWYICARHLLYLKGACTRAGLRYQTPRGDPSNPIFLMIPRPIAKELTVQPSIEIAFTDFDLQGLPLLGEWRQPHLEQRGEPGDIDLGIKLITNAPLELITDKFPMKPIALVDMMSIAALM